jgi:hypothetical protein
MGTKNKQLVVWGTFLYLTFFTVYITTTLFYYYLNKRTHYNTFFSSSVFPINYLNFTSHQSYFSITQKKIPPNMRGGAISNRAAINHPNIFICHGIRAPNNS